MNGDNSLHNYIYISLNLELWTFLTMLIQGNFIIRYTINVRKLFCAVKASTYFTNTFTTAVVYFYYNSIIGSCALIHYKRQVKF